MGNRFHWTLKHNKLTRKENFAQARFKCNILTEISVSGIFFFQVLFENNRRLKSLSHNFFLFFFYWRIIALQNFVVFCQTSTWISHRYTYISSFLNLPISLPIHPSRLIQSPYLSFLSHTANSRWLSVLHMVM